MGDIQRAAAIRRESAADPAAALPLLRSAAADPDELVRHVAALRLASLGPSDLSASAVRELLETLLRVSRVSDGSTLSSEYQEVTYDGESTRDLGQDIALALADLPAGSADFALPELLALRRRDRQFHEAALAAIALSFPEGVARTRRR